MRINEYSVSSKLYGDTVDKLSAANRRIYRLKKQLSNREVIADGEYCYDPNRMGMHMIGDVNLGDLLFENKDKYNGKRILVEVKHER